MGFNAMQPGKVKEDRPDHRGVRRSSIVGPRGMGGAVSDVRPPADLDYCYLTTTGRHTVLHRIEIVRAGGRRRLRVVGRWRPLGLGSQPDDLAGGGPRDRGAEADDAGSGRHRRGRGRARTEHGPREVPAALPRRPRGLGHNVAAGGDRLARGEECVMDTVVPGDRDLDRRGLRTVITALVELAPDEASEPRSGDPA